MTLRDELHSRLHSFREGIGGCEWKDAQTLRDQVDSLIDYALQVQPELADELLGVRYRLLNFKTADVGERLRIDDLVCNILNRQEKDRQR